MIEKIDISKLNKLQLSFLKEIGDYIKSHRNIKHNYRSVVTEEDYSFQIEVKPDHPESFAVTAHVEPWEITIIFGGKHHHHHFIPDAEYDDSESITCDAAIEFMDGLLHGNCKLVISKANGKPYWWTFYRRDHDTWRPFSTGGTLWFNFFGHRSKEEISNKIVKQ